MTTNQKTNPRVHWHNVAISFLIVLCICILCSTNTFAGSLSISWAPVSDSSVAGYKIKYGTTSGSYTQSLDVGQVTSYILNNLTEGATYYLVVVAYNSNHVEGVPSAQVSGVVLAASNISAGSISATSAVISWKTNKSSDSQVDYGTATSYGLVTPLDPTLTLSHAQTLSNLIAGTTYNYRVRSKDAGGSTTVSTNFTFTTTTDSTPPGDVQNFTAVPGNSQVTLSWINPSDSDFKGVMIRYRTDGVFPANKSDGILAVDDQTGLAGASDSFIHSGLNNGTTYSYSAFTYDTSQNYSSTAHAQATPANISITSLSPGRGDVGAAVSIGGIGFGSSQGTSTVTFNGVKAVVSAWSDSAISTTVPSNATSGPVVVTVNGVQSNGVNFKVGGKLSAPGQVRIKK